MKNTTSQLIKFTLLTKLMTLQLWILIEFSPKRDHTRYFIIFRKLFLTVTNYITFFQVAGRKGGEQGTNVTMCPFISASGKFYPGVFVFPLVNLSQRMIDSVPFGWLALANPSGWMDEGSFLILLKHFRKQIVCSPSNPVLVFLDNHGSHVGYSIVMYALEEVIILMTLPPHTSHATQPLDRCVYGPFKRFLKDAHDLWIRLHPGLRITIYDVPMISEEPIKKAFIAKNILKAFLATGLFPFNRKVIPNSMYALSRTTNLPGEVVKTFYFIDIFILSLLY